MPPTQGDDNQNLLLGVAGKTVLCMMRVQPPAEPVQLAAVQLFGAVNVVA